VSCCSLKTFLSRDAQNQPDIIFLEQWTFQGRLGVRGEGRQGVTKNGLKKEGLHLGVPLGSSDREEGDF